MSTTRDIAVIVGSLRRDSLNRKIAHVLIDVAPAPLALEIVEIGALPLYNADYDSSGDPPKEYGAFRERIRRAHGVLFVTPEYNRSVAAPMKNAIDVASRPYGHNAWGGKPGGVVSVSSGAIGGFGANHHLRQSLVFLDVPVLQQPEAYIGHAEKLFDESGHMVAESTHAFLRKYMQAYAGWVQRFVPA